MNEELMPYDITGIPYFPVMPGFYEWLYLLTGFAFSLLLIKYIALKRTAKKPLQPAFDLAMNELNKINKADFSQRGSLYDASLVSRRLLSAVENSSADSYAAKELKMWAESSNNSELSQVLDILVKVDALKFSKDCNPQGDNLIDELIEAIKIYRVSKEQGVINRGAKEQGAKEQGVKEQEEKSKGTS